MTDTATESERELGAALATRVRHLRQERSLSLDGLAKRAGLSKGTVVGIEHGEANPSIGVLCRLAAAFSLSVADLLSDPGKDGSGRPIERTIAATLWSGPQGGRARLEASTSGRTMFELWSWILMPGEVFQAEAHSPDTHELISVEQGCLRITVGSETLTLHSGEAARLLTDRPHTYAAGGEEAVRFAMAVLERGEAVRANS